MNGWAIVSVDMRRFHYVGATHESAAKWLRYRLKHQARGEQYIGPVEVRVISPNDGDTPASVPRSELTGNQLIAAYESG